MGIKEMINRLKGKKFTPFKVEAVYVNIELIYDWCANNGYSITEFCKQVGILRQSFYQYGKGQSPSLATRRKIMRITGLKEKDLFIKNGKAQRGRVSA
jgi:DNA-binding XRE family transcriptional regulator